MRKFRSILGACALALPLVAAPGVLAGSASATTPATTPAAAPAAPAAPAADGNFWVWEHANFNGAACGWSGNDASWRTCGHSGRFNMNDRASSWRNSGYSGAYGDVRLYEHASYTGASTCAPNGGSGNLSRSWNDRVSSHKWVTNCGY
ncbi:peptidase inhibitor family I36 protein [Streptomyces sp. JJ66]|uniref:peptidase inhibitor family I36 protein n=1 Tax=Streptomyces sp. JJ66 TaxID=2803843 RepID=UPI001C569B7B|nr:peptidase inhibitor family I36 protein [Streptomyces sp. JJ66]MBW1601409.1 peptidase inhibitor family I36 protein [Streptomyces sp. JJ66]